MRLVILALLVLASGLVYADDNARFALVIGNSSYDGDAKLANPANDANDVAEALASIGWKVTTVIDGDRKTMNRAVANFRDVLAGSVQPTALLYFAGHGVQISGQNYLIPVGETFETSDDVETDAVSLQRIQDAFDEAKVATNIIILDACRDNPFSKKLGRSLGNNRGLSPIVKSAGSEGSAVLFATSPGETASDGLGRNGVFTKVLLKYIRSDLKLQDIVTKITADVRKQTGGKQIPYNSLSLYDDFYFVPASLRSSHTSPTLVQQSFNLNVKGPIPGMDVLVDGIQVGKTPYSARYDSAGSFTLEVVHPSYEPYREVIDPIGRDSISVETTQAPLQSFQTNSLVTRRELLERQLQVAENQSKWVPWVNIGSWVLTAGTGAASAYLYSQSYSLMNQTNSAVASGQSAQSTSLNNQFNSTYSSFKVSLGVGAVALVVAVVTSFLYPDVPKIKKQISDLDVNLSGLSSTGQ